VDFYGSWQNSGKPGKEDALVRNACFIGSAFPYDAERDIYTCPMGQALTHHAVLNREHGVKTHVQSPQGSLPRVFVAATMRS